MKLKLIEVLWAYSKQCLWWVNRLHRGKLQKLKNLKRKRETLKYYEPIKNKIMGKCNINKI